MSKRTCKPDCGELLQLVLLHVRLSCAIIKLACTGDAPIVTQAGKGVSNMGSMCQEEQKLLSRVENKSYNRNIQWCILEFFFPHLSTVPLIGVYYYKNIKPVITSPPLPKTMASPQTYANIIDTN